MEAEHEIRMAPCHDDTTGLSVVKHSIPSDRETTYCGIALANTTGFKFGWIDQIACEVCAFWHKVKTGKELW